MKRSRSSNSFNASNRVTRRGLATDVSRVLQRLPECFTFTQDGLLLLGDLQLAPERLGSDSAVGVVYRSTIDGQVTVFDTIASKIVPNTEAAQKELRIMQLCTEAVMQKTCQHLPILYGHRACMQACQGARCLKQMQVPYLAMFNELAAGDLAAFLRSRPSEAACHSAVMQCVIAAMSLHSLGVVHEDGHFANFLYHTVPSRGSWSYRLGNTKFSVPNCGQLFVIFDFDQSSFMDDDTEAQAYGRMWDYTRLLTSVLPVLPPAVAGRFEKVLLTVMPKEDMRDYTAVLGHMWTSEDLHTFLQAFMSLASRNLYVTENAVNANAYNLSM